MNTRLEIKDRVDILPIIEDIRAKAQKTRLADLRQRLHQERHRLLESGMPLGRDLPKLTLPQFKKKLSGSKRPLAFVFYGLYRGVIPFVHAAWRYFRYLDIKTRREEYVLDFFDNLITEIELIQSSQHDKRQQ